MIVHSLNSKRALVNKELIIEDGKVYIEYEGQRSLIEKDVKVWNTLNGNRLRDNVVNMINLTSKCNLNCDYCYFKKLSVGWKRGSEISLEQAKKAVLMVKDVSNSVKNKALKDVLLDDSCFPKIRLSGGEPTVWDQLPELLHFIVKNKNNSISILSNGLKLASKEYIKKIPPVPQIIWAVSARDTSRVSHTAVENVLANNNQLIFNLVLTDNDAARRLTDFCVKWNTQGIRYRVLVDYLTGEVFGCQSDMINFICNYFGIDKDFYLSNCLSTSPYISGLPYSISGQPFSLVTVLTPTWKVIVLEEAIKSKTFLFSYMANRYDTLLIEIMNESKDFKKWRKNISNLETVT